MGRIVISEAFKRDSEHIQLIAEQNEVASAYFSLLGRARPVGLMYEKLSGDDPMFGKVMHAELHIRRKVFLAAFAENMNLMYYAERDSGVEVEV